ncbi:MAG: efflux RND transporter permease subunit [Myxococcales bacterium]|nr:MAG: efflux RND transporter permease subunit [Myxococcales bacterium]
MSLPRFFVRQTVLVNMLMVAVFVAGIFALGGMAVEQNPSIDLDAVVIVVNYPGASPEDVEKLITLPIEDRIATLPDIDYIIGASYEGRASFYVQYEADIDNFDQAVLDLKSEVDKAKPEIPKDAADSIWFIKIATDEVWPVMGIVLGGEYSTDGLNDIAEALKEELLDVEDVGSIQIYGVKNREIWVEADRARLDAYSLAISDITAAVQAANINLPAGRVEMGREEFLVRPMGEIGDPGEIGRVVLRGSLDGSSVRVGDVAEVRDTFERDEIQSRLNGKPSVSVRVFMKRGGSVVDIVDEAREIVDRFQRQIPDVDLSIRHDASKDVRESVNVLTTNALTGVALVTLLLTFTMGWRAAVLAALGIPFAFLTAFIFLYATGGTINTLSLFAFILVSGMLVDDAIIIIENVYAHLEQGKNRIQAAIDGAEQVMWPVFSAITTTIAAFLPLLLMQGVIGKFLAVLPVVVSLALAGSLFQALVVLPSHLADFAKLPEKKERLSDRFFSWLLRIYKREINRLLDHKYLTTLGTMAVTVAATVVAASILRIELFPEESSSSERLLVRLPIGTKLEETDRVLMEIERRIATLPKHEVDAVSTLAGLVVENQQWLHSSDGGMVTIDLGDKDGRRSNDEIKDSIRALIADIPGIRSIYFGRSDSGPPTGSPVELRVRGESLERMRGLAQAIVDDLKSVKGVSDVQMDFSEGKKELRFLPDRVKMSAYGLTMTQLAVTLRTAVEGWEATKFRDEKGDEVKVLVMYRETDRDEVDDLKRLTVSTPLGVFVPLSELGEFAVAPGAAAIARRDGKRAITVTANVNQTDINSDEANRYVREKYADFAVRYPGYSLEFGGQAEEQQESFQSLVKAFIVALILIYLILGTQFHSFVQPLIVMLTVPFSILGVAIGLIVSQLTFSLVAGISVVALAGVVVNDSLVLVDFINKARAAGKTRREALVMSGMRRMRPILLTTITTICGLLPLALGFGGESVTWQPMAIGICWGIAFATFLTLFVIPAFYSIFDDWTNAMRRWFGRQSTDRELAEHAAELRDDTVLREL